MPAVKAAAHCCAALQVTFLLSRAANPLLNGFGNTGLALCRAFPDNTDVRGYLLLFSNKFPGVLRNWLRVVAPVTAFALAVVPPALAETGKEQLKVGLSLPLSGTAKMLGEQFEQGARKAVADLSAGNRISLVIADDGCDEEIAGLAAKDLRAANVSMVTGLLCNATARVLAEEFEAGGTPLLVAGARSERLLKDAQREGWHLWRMSPGDDDVASAAHRILSQRWQATPWAIIDDGTVHGRTLADSFRALMEETGQPPQFADNFRPAQSTQAGLIRRLRQSGVSAAFVAAGADDVATIWANRNEFGDNFEIVGGEPLAALPWTETSPQIDDGLLAIIRTDPRATPRGRELADEFVKAGIEPGEYAFLGYSVIQIALSSLAADPDQTNAALSETAFNTVTGIYAFGPDGARRGDDFALHIWKNGRFVRVGKAVEQE